jgi:hypothetical protein
MTTRGKARFVGATRHLVAGLVALGLLPGPAARADASAADKLAPIVARVLSYERTLAQRAGRTVDVIVLFDKTNRASVEEARAFDSAFEELEGTTVQGLPLLAQQVANAPGALERALAAGGDVVLVCSGLESQLSVITRETRHRHALTIGVRREHVQAGTAMAVIIEQDKPKILANLGNANAEGVQLSAQLLRRSEIL